MKRARLLVATIVLLLAAPSAARAHAFLEHAVPSVGAKVRSAPRDVTLRFSEKLEPAFCDLRVLDAAGRRVDRGDGRVDTTDPGILRVSLQAIAPGVYKVSWRAVSVDGHVTEGNFTFEVVR